MQSANTNAINHNVPANSAGSHELDQLVSDLQTVLSSALKQRIGGLFQEYAVYKETHDAVMRIPAVVQNARTMIRDTVVIETSESSDSNFENIIRRLTSENDHLKAQLAAALSVSANTHDHHHDQHDHHHGDNIRLIVEEAANEPLSEQVHARGNSIVSSDSIVAEDEEEDEESHDTDNTDDDDEEEEVEEEADEVIAVVEEEEKNVAIAVAEDVDVEEGEEEEEDEEEEEEEEEDEEEVEEEVEVIEIAIKGKSYFTTNETNGIIYDCTRDGDIGNEVGNFEGGRPKFNKK